MLRERCNAQEKFEVVEAVIQGMDLQEACKQFEVPEDRVEAWLNAFHTAGKRSLRFYADGSLPTVEQVEHSAQRAFPYKLFHRVESACCFFTAQFYGKNDVVHLNRVGVKNVTLVDLDKKKLEHMEEIYPETWETVVADAFEFASAALAAGKQYELVVCDPYSGMASEVSFEKGKLFFDLASRFFCSLYTKPMFEDDLGDLQLADDPIQLGRRLGEFYGGEVNVALIAKRSSHLDGIYWVVIEKKL